MWSAVVSDGLPSLEMTKSMNWRCLLYPRDVHYGVFLWKNATAQHVCLFSVWRDVYQYVTVALSAGRQFVGIFEVVGLTRKALRSKCQHLFFVSFVPEQDYVEQLNEMLLAYFPGGYRFCLRKRTVMLRWCEVTVKSCTQSSDWVIFNMRSYKKKLRRYKDVIRSLASRHVSRSRKKETLLKFHAVIPLIIKPLLQLLDDES